MAVSQERQEEIIKAIVANMKEIKKKDRHHWRGVKDRLLLGSNITWGEYFYLANEPGLDGCMLRNSSILESMMDYAEICIFDPKWGEKGESDEKSENEDLIERIPCKALIKSGARKGAACAKINCGTKSHKVVEKLDFGE